MRSRALSTTVEYTGFDLAAVIFIELNLLNPCDEKDKLIARMRSNVDKITNMEVHVVQLESMWDRKRVISTFLV